MLLRLVNVYQPFQLLLKKPLQKLLQSPPPKLLANYFLALNTLFSVTALTHADPVSSRPASDTKEYTRPLVFSYWTEASAPFAMYRGNRLEQGIIKDLGHAMAKYLGREVKFSLLPSKRIEPYLINGDIDFDCITNPMWKERPDAYRWSPSLFDGADRFLVRHGESNDITDFKNLKGRILGIYQGYVYHPTIMKMIETKQVATVKVSDIDKGLQLLKLKRIDALIDFGVVLSHQLKAQNLHDSLTLATLPADTFKLHCAYSHKVDIDYTTIDNAFRALISDGQLRHILNKYL